MSRTEPKRRFAPEDNVLATAEVECRKDADVIDETPMAYKDIDTVMAAQSGLVGGGAHPSAGGVCEGMMRGGWGPIRGEEDGPNAFSLIWPKVECR